MKKSSISISISISIAALSALAVGFGLMTLKSGGFALFGGAEGKQFAGDYVPFVLWFNFCAGVFYIVAGVGIFLRKTWSANLAKAIATLTLAVFVAFGVTVLLGAPYETRTVGAMAFRTTFWIVTALLAKRMIGSASTENLKN